MLPVETEAGDISFIGAQASPATQDRNSNKNYKKPLVFGIPNVQIGKHNFAHMLCCTANGFDPENGRPRTKFHSFVIKIKIKDEQEQFFLSRGVKQDNIVDITLDDGTVVTDKD